MDAEQVLQWTVETIRRSGGGLWISISNRTNALALDEIGENLKRKLGKPPTSKVWHWDKLVHQALAEAEKRGIVERYGPPLRKKNLWKLTAS